MDESTLLLRLIQVVIAVTVVEGLALLVWHRLRGGGVAPADYLANMVAGLCLMGAMVGMARGAGLAWVAAWLLAAGVAHGTDLFTRWRRRTAPPPGAVVRGIA